MGSLEARLRRLEQTLVHEPTIQEYIDAKRREEIRALNKLAGLLALHGFVGTYLFREGDRQMLAEDTSKQRDRDREIIEAWYRSQGIDWEAEAEGAKEELEAMLKGKEDYRLFMKAQRLNC